jgi:hypothetical protein
MRTINCSMILLCCASGFCAEPDTAALIRNLDSEEFSVREKASKDLLALGSKVLPHLQMALTKADSAEVIQRLNSVIKVIEDETIGGAIVGGYQLVLKKATDIGHHELLAFDLLLYNRSEMEKPELNPLNFSYQLTGEAEEFDEPVAGTVFANVIIKKISGEGAILRAQDELKSRDSHRLNLASGERLVTRLSVPLHDSIEVELDYSTNVEMPLTFKPGECEVQIVYTRYPKTENVSQIKSNVLRFTVEEK